MVTVHNISKSYHKHVALKSINIDIPEGAIFGLLGPNGAGKTTLIRIINQIIEPDTGEIKIRGKDLSAEHIRNIGYLPEERGLYKKMKVGEQLIYFGQLRGLSRRSAVESIKKWTKKLEIYDWLNRKVEDLSKGMAQKIQFISTIMHEPELIILDEPFSGFDPVNANLIRDEILEFRKKGHTIIFSTHRMESAEDLCDNICLIHESKTILNGTKKEIKDSYKKEIFIVEHEGSVDLQNGQMEVIESEALEDYENHYRSRIKLNGISGNEFLRQIIDQTNVKSFNEDIPSLNDIFIELTTTKNE